MGLPRLAESGLRGQEGSTGITIVAPVMGGDVNANVVTIKPAYVFDVRRTDARTPRAAAG